MLPFLTLIWMAGAGCSAGDALEPPAPPDGEAPRVLDERLELSLFAEDPAIVTPIGIAVDGQDRVYVLESHTHSPPQDYPGPDSDRVKVFVDADGDGSADTIRVFADGLDDGMNLAFSPEGELHVVTARGVWALHDRDGDGRSEARTRILRLARPESVFDHSALLGLAFSSDRWLYVSRGNTGGAHWRLEGTDGSFLEGYGDGGNIVRARPDGSELEEFATGFWNPFDLSFGPEGRLLAVDNDPDSRGPNRLVHVVAGGDYGYKTLHGPSGVHPYVAWNGELPGTLPYAAALGEAPSGLVVANRAALPDDYAGDLLATIWEESRIVRIPLRERGTSVIGTARSIIEGGPGFRPVAFAVDSRGTLYFTDWKIRDYPNHGTGRIWRLRSREAVTPVHEAPGPAKTNAAEASWRLERLASADRLENLPALLDALSSGDPFVRHAAVMALRRPVFREAVVAALQHASAEVRLGALLALERAGPSRGRAAEIAGGLLSDPDERVRQAALLWIGRAGLLGLRDRLETAIRTGSPSPQLFETYLATVEQLQPAFIAAVQRREGRAGKIEGRLPDGFLEEVVTTEGHAPELRALAIGYLREPDEQLPLLLRLAGPGNPPPVRLEAVRSLAYAPGEDAASMLLRIARSRADPASLRAEAVAALGRQPARASMSAKPLLDDSVPEVREEAERLLRSRPPEPERNRAPAEWRQLLASGGDPVRGRRVFHAPWATCSQCHRHDRRGGTIGPDLTNVARSKSREQLVDAILTPSAEISPEYQGWFIRTEDGATYYGRQIDVGRGGAELMMSNGEFRHFTDISEYGAMEESLMPEGLESRFTDDELRDLLAFLAADAAEPSLEDQS